MTREQYIRKILKRIKVTDKTKARIKSDLQTELQSREEAGETMEQIIAQKGSPQVVADAFNGACDAQMRRQYRARQSLKAAAFMLIALALVLLCVNWIGNAAVLGSTSVGIIGGADGPTRIFVARQPAPFFANPSMLVNVIGGLILAAGIVCLAVWLILRNR